MKKKETDKTVYEQVNFGVNDSGLAMGQPTEGQTAVISKFSLGVIFHMVPVLRP